MTPLVALCTAALLASWLYVRMWIVSPMASWRARHTERGEASWQLVVIAVALLAAIVVLSLEDKDIPDVLTSGLAGVLFGIGGGEVSMRRAEQRNQIPARTRKPRPTNTKE